MSVHIYCANDQPATRYVDDCAGEPHTFTNTPRTLLWVGCCYRRRRAENCIVHVYYDCIRFWCAPGRGCKSEKEIIAKLNREYRNRSRAAKAVWAARRRPTNVEAK